MLTGLVLAAAIGAFSSRVRAAQLTVTSIADSGVGSLRAAIQTANANGNSTNAIVFALGSNQTIILTSSLPPILGNLTVDGSSSPNLIINGNNASSVFFVAGGAVTIKDVSIANAFAQGGQGGTGSTGGGGGLGAGAAIFVNAGTTTIVNVNFLNNGAAGGAGGTVGAGSNLGGGGGGGLRGNGGNGGEFSAGGGGGILR